MRLTVVRKEAAIDHLPFWSSVVTAEPSYAQRDKTTNAMPSILGLLSGKCLPRGGDIEI